METDGIISMNAGYAASERPAQETGKGGNGFLYFLGGMLLGGVISGFVIAKSEDDKIKEFSPASVRYTDVDGDSKEDIVIFRNNGLYDVFLQREEGGEVVYRKLGAELSLLDSKAFGEKVKLEEAVGNSIKGLIPEGPVEEKQKGGNFQPYTLPGEVRH